MGSGGGARVKLFFGALRRFNPITWSTCKSSQLFPDGEKQAQIVGRSRVYGGVVPAPTEKKHRKRVCRSFAELKFKKLPTKEST